MTAASMTLQQVIILVFYTLGMAVGQMLFMVAAGQLTPGGGPLGLISLFTKLLFLCTVTFYGVLILAWDRILSDVPLSKAYPFSMLALAITPMLAFVFFGNTISEKYYIGLSLTCAGLLLIAHS